MTETRKLAAILAADVVGYSRSPARTRTHARRLRALRSDLIDPPSRSIGARGQAHRRRRSRRVPQRRRRGTLRDRNPERHGRAQRRRARGPRIEFRIGIHLGDVVEETDGDLMATESISRRGWKASLGPGRSVCPRTPTGRSKRASISPSPISVRPNSRTSPSRSAPIRWKSASRRAKPRRRRSRRSRRSPRQDLRCPTSLRSRCCRSRT